MKLYKHGMKCMMLRGGRLVFHPSDWNHCFVGGFLNFIKSWSIFEVLLVIGYSYKALKMIVSTIISLSKSYSNSLR